MRDNKPYLVLLIPFLVFIILLYLLRTDIIGSDNHNFYEHSVHGRILKIKRTGRDLIYVYLYNNDNNEYTSYKLHNASFFMCNRIVHGDSISKIKNSESMKIYRSVDDSIRLIATYSSYDTPCDVDTLKNGIYLIRTPYESP